MKKLNVAGHRDCLACNRPMRPAHWTVADAPGTIAHHGKGVCASCAKRQERGVDSTEYKPKGERSERCIDCDRTMRPRLARAADYPGTVEHRGNGRCQTCGRRRIQALKSHSTKPKPPELTAITGIDPAHDAYLRKRRERLARQQRLAQVRRPAA